MALTWTFHWALIILPALTLSRSVGIGRVIDLSYTEENTTIYWPGLPGWQLEVLQRGFIEEEDVWLEYGVYTSGEHGGTHVDSPRHVVPDGLDLDGIPLENTMADGVMVDAIEEVKANSSYAVTIDKLLSWERVYGRIPDRAGVLFNFGWGRTRWPDVQAYLNTETPDDTRTISYPHLTGEAARWLVAERDVMMVGMDTPSPDLPSAVVPGLPAHMAFLGKNRMVLENVNLTSELPATGFQLHATPIKVVKGTGVQTRVFAILL